MSDPDTNEPSNSFEEFSIHPDIVRGMVEHGYDHLLQVQAACIQPIRDGQNVSLRSRTGSGKTAAFAIPLLERLDPDRKEPQVLVLAPTRELAGQIATEVNAVGKYRGLKALPIYGGAPIAPQIRALKEGVHVVAGTPGRLLDLAGQGVL